MPKNPLSLPTAPLPRFAGGNNTVPGQATITSAGSNAICVCERASGAFPTIAQPAGLLSKVVGPTFAGSPHAEARRILDDETPPYLPSQAEPPVHSETQPGRTELDGKFASPEPAIRANETEPDDDDTCKEKDVPCLDPDFLDGPGYIADQRPPRKEPEFVGDEPPCDPDAPKGKQIDDEVAKLTTMWEASARTEEGEQAAQADREEAARNLGRWAKEFPEVADKIKREVIRWKESETNKFHSDGPELKRLEKWARETSAAETARVEADFERAQTGPVLGELGLLLAVDPSEMTGREGLEAKAEEIRATATLKELKDAILHLRKRLNQLSTRDPHGRGRDPRRVCFRGVKTTYDAELVRDFIKKMLKEMLSRLQDEAIKARTIKPKDLSKFPFSFEDLRNPGVSEKILEFRDFLDFANGGYEDLLGLDSAASGLIDEIERSGLDVEDSWTDQEIAKDIFKRLQDLRR